jgi:hypothetical protein
MAWEIVGSEDVSHRPSGSATAKRISRRQQVVDLQRIYCQAQKPLTFHLPTEIQIPLGSVNK